MLRPRAEGGSWTAGCPQGWAGSKQAADDDLDLLCGVEDFGVDRVVFADEDIDVGDATLEFVARHHDMVDGIAGELEVDPVGEGIEQGTDKFRRDEGFAFHGGHGADSSKKGWIGQRPKKN